jgi:hypothetical protein
VEPPDRLEKRIRFGCGFLLGCLVAAGALMTLIGGYIIVASCLAAGLLLGYLAMKFGDSFWERVTRWLP